MLFSLILFLAAYLPFQVALNPVAGVDLASVRVVILVMFFAWLAKGLRSKKVHVPANFQTACLAMFLFLNVLSLFFARNVDWGIRKLFFLLSIVPIYFVAAEVIKNRAQIKKVISWLVISGSAAAFLGIVQFTFQFFIGIDKLFALWSKYVAVIFLGKTFSQAVFNHPSWLVDISGHTYFRAISIFPDPHMLAFFLGLLLPLAMALLFEDKKMFWLGCALMIFLADVLTFSRGGYLGLLGGAVALFFIFQERIVKKHKTIFFSVLAGIILLLAVPGPVSSRFFSSFNAEEGSNNGRLAMWKAAAISIERHPLVGVGLGNFPLAVNPLTTYREPIYAHNTYLDVASEAGLLAAAAWLSMLFFSSLSFLKKAREDKFYLGAAISLVIFSVHSIVETGIYSPVVLTMLMLIIAFSSVKENYEKIS